MKILAIRGQNLASLEGDFALEMELAPLAGSGLFAITGPTGAGKSTLLDALCLALFDQTPRLSNHGGFLVGREEEEPGARVRSNDVRAMLRRGAATGFAEVDFAGQDGKRYRSRWTVHRARMRKEGRLQDARMELTELESGKALGGNKTETLLEIQSKLGLSFDQFRRSALLAQGEFAAFLKAEATERAQLLERVTGTEVYGEISKAAFRRAAAEKLALEELGRQLGDLKLLESEARAKLELEVAARRKAWEDAQARQRASEKAAEWYDQLARLKTEEAAAAGRVQDADRAWEASEPERRELDAVLTAQPLRPVVSAADAAVAAKDRAARQLAALREADEKARAVLSEREEHFTRSEEARKAARRALAGAKPELERASGLDAEIRAATTQLEAAAAEAATTAADASLASARAAQLEREIEAAASARADALAWLESHVSVQPLAANWTRLRQELLSYTEAVRLAAGAAAARPRSVAREQAAREVLETSERLRDGALDLRDRAREASAAAGQASAAFDRAALRTQGQSLNARLLALASLGEIPPRLARLEAARFQAALEASHCAAQAEWAADEARSARRHRASVLASLEEAQHALEGARAARDLQGLRSDLRPGEPCPLCGSQEHPWRAAAPEVEGTIARETARVKALQDESSRLALREGSELERRKTVEQRGAAALDRLSRLRDEMAQAQASWELARLESLPREAGGPAAEAALAALRSATEAQLEALRQQEARGDELAAAALQAGKELVSAQSELDAAQIAREEAERALRAAQDALRELDREADSARQNAQRALEALEPALEQRSGWLARLNGVPGAFLQECESDVALLNQKKHQLDEASAALEARRPQQQNMRALAEGKRGVAEQAERHRAGSEAKLGELRAQRSATLGGRPTSEVEAELHAHETAAAEALDVARRLLEDTRQASALAGFQVAGAAEAQRLAVEAAAQASRALEKELAGSSMALERLRELLSRGEDWIGRQRRAVDALRQAQAEARTRLDERRARREQHETSNRPELPEEQARLDRDSALGAVDQAHQTYYAVRRELDRDDEDRARAAALRPRLEAQQSKAALWASISDLIGSADGNRFRKYAQSLTLDLLVAHANEHLKDLARRYRLARVPGTDLDLQIVDRDMGDDVRSINSLSGGESFLVSLALALGLASLSARETSVESLFIDEGFGSLDQDTLEMALSTLDALQASGRKVGLISHVPGMAERIGTQVKVTPRGGGRSSVHVEGLGD